MAHTSTDTTHTMVIDGGVGTVEIPTTLPDGWQIHTNTGRQFVCAALHTDDAILGVIVATGGQFLWSNHHANGCADTFNEALRLAAAMLAGRLDDADGVQVLPDATERLGVAVSAAARYTCWRDGGKPRGFYFAANAIAWGRKRESFEVYRNADDKIVYQERPEVRWV